MFLKTSRCMLGLGLLSLTVLGGCVAGDDGDSVSGDGSFSFTAEIEVLDIVQPTSQSAGTIETRSIEYSCDGDDLVADTSEESSNFVVTGGSLLQWDAGECRATKLQGSSSGIIGKWTTTNGYQFDSVPAAYRGASCTDDDDDIEVDSVVQDFKATYDISSTRIKTTASGRMCMGSVYAMLFAADDSEEGDLFELVSSDCGTATIRNTVNDKKLKLTTKLSNTEIAVTYTSSGKSCTLRSQDPSGFSNRKPTCPERDFEAQQEEFSECVEKLPFFQGMGMAKQSAASDRSRQARDILKQIEGSLRGF